jgi:DNA-binding transcriptional ArsR family regulator
MPPETSELMTALNHPLRRRILRIYIESALPSASAQEIARATGQPVARASYHLRTLAQCNILRPVEVPRESGAGGRSPRWVLEAEPEWLRLVLDLWGQADDSG